ncbi:hypothetical protein D9M70_570840 [compost metagenome]
MPILPHGLAQSKTGRCSFLRNGAPSSVIAPQTWMLAASMSFLEKPMCSSRLKSICASCSSVTFSVPLRKSAPSVHWLKTNLISKADFRAALTASIFSSVKPLTFSVEGLIAGAWLRLPWPTA